MTATTLLLAALAFAADPAPAASPAPPPPAPVMVGGWSPIAEPNHDLETGRAAAFAAAQIKRRHARLASVERAERQVVAGMNYRMVIVLADRTRWRAEVWKRLDGTYALSRSERVR